MARLFVVVAALACVSWLFPCRLPACSFCPTTLKRETLSSEFDRAQLVIYGYVAQSHALPSPGSTEFHIEKVIKNDPILEKIARKDAKRGVTALTLPRYLPVLDAKDPPRLVIFCDVRGDKWEATLGRQVKSAAVVDYLAGARTENAKGRLQALAYFARFLDHADNAIAEDAFLEFARSNDEDVGRAAKLLTPEAIRKLLQRPQLDGDRISLFAFLLGSCGEPADADYLRKRIDQAREEDLRALDGLLAGYICLRPKEGWKLTHDTLADRRAGFIKRFSALRTVRFYQGYKPAETKAQMLQGYQAIIPDGEMADMAIEDLRRWKHWDLTPLILAQYAKESHNVPIVRRSIVRYALCSPQPEAREFVDRIQARDGELVAEIRESLEFEKR